MTWTIDRLLALRRSHSVGTRPRSKITIEGFSPITSPSTSPTSDKKKVLPSKTQVKRRESLPPSPPRSESNYINYTIPEDSTTTQESSRRGSSNDVESDLASPITAPASSDGEDIDIKEEDFDFPLPPSSVQIDVLDIDKETPDKHVPRDPRLIRLTGIHPFNVEAPLTDLFDSGFLTPTELFYVRNHGAVPEVFDHEVDTWEISIEGLVENPITLTLKQIRTEFEQITVPITLVCAGNRRKEQNMVRKSQGFSWGPAGVSTSLFTGVMMKDIIAMAKPTRKAKYVCMEGADLLPNGYYGTNAKLSWVNDLSRGIMLAYKMNGEMLRPDHGRPLRAVIPGQIGGRSVKWLKKLILTDGPSDNWYHIYDNRVLPTMVTPEMSKQDPMWWRDERYAIYDLSVNSAIAYPQHEEVLDLSTASNTYNLRGYAYGGGGRRIGRVEISTDRGATWSLANITYPEDLYRPYDNTNLFGGRLDMSWRDGSHCWCFWSLEVATDALANSEGILLRAMDDAMNLQPRDMYWSVLGMMNNPWYRVAIRKDKEGTLRFEHPTQPALISGGWMERVKKEGGNLLGGNWGELAPDEEPREPPAAAEEIKMTRDDVKRIIELDEFKAHENAEEPWFVVKGEVYDGKPFLEGHPGGATSITAAAGTDATEEFMAIHSESAKAMMPKYHIGTLSEAATKALASADGPTVDETSPTFLNPKVWQKTTLIEKKVISWDTRIYTFQLQHDKQIIGLPIGQHLMIRVKDEKNSETIIRSYTPISQQNLEGKLELLVKVYFSSKDMPGGKMTMALDALPMGAQIDVKGPTGKLEYLEKGRLTISGVERKVKSFAMICGGSGITPIFQVLRAVMQDPEDMTNCVVFDGNRLEEDILCREELDMYERENSHKCKIFHTLSNPSDTWTGLKGRLSKELIMKEMPKEDMLILVCGPPAMEKDVKQILLDEGFGAQDMVFF